MHSLYPEAKCITMYYKMHYKNAFSLPRSKMHDNILKGNVGGGGGGGGTKSYADIPSKGVVVLLPGGFL